MLIYSCLFHRFFWPWSAAQHPSASFSIRHISPRLPPWRCLLHDGHHGTHGLHYRLWWLCISFHLGMGMMGTGQMDQPPRIGWSGFWSVYLCDFSMFDMSNKYWAFTWISHQNDKQLVFFVENTRSLKASPKKRNLSMFFQVPPPRWISCPTFPKHRQLHPMQAWLSPNRVWHHLPKSLSPSQLPRSPWSSVFLTIHVMRKKTPSITQLLHNFCMQMTFCRLRVANLNRLLCKTCNQCVR